MEFVGLFLFLTFHSCFSLPEQGKWVTQMNNVQPGNHYVAFTKSMYNQSTVSLQVECSSENADCKVGLSWILRYSPCAEEYINLDVDGYNRKEVYFNIPYFKQIDYEYQYAYYLRSQSETLACQENIHLKDYRNANFTVHKVETKESMNNITVGAAEGSSQKQQDINPAVNPPAANPPATNPPATNPPAVNPPAVNPPAVNPPAVNPPAANVPASTGKAAETPSKTANEASKEQPNKETPASKSKRSPEEQPANTKDAAVPPTVKATTAAANKGKQPKPGGGNPNYVIAKTWEDGIYLLVVNIWTPGESENQGKEDKDKTFNITMTVQMKAEHGFLSAIEWPLLVFYGVMCIVYVIYGLVWLVLLACNWRDILRIQFWIGGVIVLGMLEKAIFYAEYQTINSTGSSVKGAVVFAELVSCLKRTVARMLVVIVSMGFGIVKPRLGPMLHKVLGMGGLYFILGSVEGCLRVLKPKGDTTNQALLASIPLAVLDASICWWVFTSLMQTVRTLRLRRNIVKLSLYRHFTNTLIFTVIASVGYMIWSIKMHKFTACLSDWKEIWVDDAFWHLLFSVMLAVIMILWRPTNNNQRYAFSPLLDAADEEDVEPLVSDAFDTVKMRGLKGQNGSPRQKTPNDKTEEDLKWIEENIPASVADTALPGILDSDEEIMTTKYEMSKMQ
ncbi:unnamed protein product [Owenia fusiformis]|uniref:Uncharacterized protein n=1 Tax=Owenia fusiformis TaxID=6347 RepID=A0A8J1ULH3_OWEFU|nr:unnamed protein product [Owenia fusiformis]